MSTIPFLVHSLMCKQRQARDQIDPDSPTLLRGPVPLSFLDHCACRAITDKLLMMLMLWVPKAVRTKRLMESMENREFKNHDARRLYVDELTYTFPGGKWPSTPTTEARPIDTHMWNQFDEDWKEILMITWTW